MDYMLQIWIAVTGFLSAWLVTSSSVRRRFFGCLSGVLALPAWGITTVTNHQWGALFLTIIYAACYVRGLLRTWAQISASKQLEPITNFSSARFARLSTLSEKSNEKV